LLQNLRAGNGGLANAGHQLRTDYGVRELEAELVNDGCQADGGLPVSIVRHRNLPRPEIMSQIIAYGGNLSQKKIADLGYLKNRSKLDKNDPN
jgi:hypothetical protein